MIVDSIENASKYYAINREFETVFDKLKELMKNHSNNEKYAISEKSMIRVENDLKLRDRECLYEYHEKYVDIHLCLKNVETIEYASEKSSLIEGDEEEDLFLAKGDYSGEVVLTEGMFALFFTSELHKPLLGNTENVVSKCVVKIYDAE